MRKRTVEAWIDLNCHFCWISRAFEEHAPKGYCFRSKQLYTRLNFFVKKTFWLLLRTCSWPFLVVNLVGFFTLWYKWIWGPGDKIKKSLTEAFFVRRLNERRLNTAVIHASTSNISLLDYKVQKMLKTRVVYSFINHKTSEQHPSVDLTPFLVSRCISGRDHFLLISVRCKSHVGHVLCVMHALGFAGFTETLFLHCKLLV